MNDSGAQSDSSAADPSEPAMTLKEEQLAINTELVETGRVRLVKRVEVETVTRTIELRREVLEVHQVEALVAGDVDKSAPTSEGQKHEPLTVLDSGPLAPGSLQEGSMEIVLMQEEALITTEIVPRERVRLTKQVISENRTIDADLQAEQADLSHDPQ